MKGTKYNNNSKSGLRTVFHVNENPMQIPQETQCYPQIDMYPLNSIILEAKRSPSKVGMSMLDGLEPEGDPIKELLTKAKEISYEKRSTNALDYNAKNSTVLKEHEKWTNGYVNGAGPRSQDNQI